MVEWWSEATSAWNKPEQSLQEIMLIALIAPVCMLAFEASHSQCSAPCFASLLRMLVSAACSFLQVRLVGALQRRIKWPSRRFEANGSNVGRQGATVMGCWKQAEVLIRRKTAHSGTAKKQARLPGCRPQGGRTPQRGSSVCLDGCYLSPSSAGRLAGWDSLVLQQRRWGSGSGVMSSSRRGCNMLEWAVARQVWNATHWCIATSCCLGAVASVCLPTAQDRSRLPKAKYSD